MEDSIDNAKPPSGGLKMEICFIIFGIGSLLGWNAILSDISFFMNYQSKYDPSISFPFCNYAFNILFQLILIWKKQFLSYKTQLIIGVSASIISLVILPLFAILFEKNSLIGFIFTAIIILILGFVNALCSSGFFGLTSFFPRKMIIYLSTGQGLSGILMNIISFIVISCVNTGNKDEDAKLSAIIFFSISGLILLITLITLLLAYKTEYFKYYLGKAEDFNNSKIENIESEVDNFRITTNSALSENNEEIITKKEENESKNKKEEVTFKELFKQLYEIDLLSCYLYIITFSLFPGVAISQRLFKTGKYRQITIITINNIFGTLGRYIISCFKFTKALAYIIICGRTIIVVTLILNFYFDMKLGLDPILSSIFLILNVVILATTNGMGTTLCMGLAPTMVNDEMKGRAGSSVSFFNILGIFLGALVAFLSKYIINQIGIYVEND